MKFMNRQSFLVLTIFVSTFIFYLSVQFGASLYDRGQGFETERLKRPVIAKVVEIKGQAEARKFARSGERGQMAWTPLKPESSIDDLDFLRVSPRSELDIETTSGYQLKFLENSEFLIERWGSTHTTRSPLYLHMIQGNYEVTRKGQRGTVFIQKDSRLFYPESGLRIEDRPIVVSPAAYAKLTEKEDLLSAPKPPKLDEEESSPQPKKISTTLSDEYLFEVFGAHQPQFQRCHAQALRDNKPAQGDLMVGVEIRKNGRVKSANLLSSSLKNPVFEKCVTEVVRRMNFKPFKGETIAVSFPLSFE